jgi:RNA polymerase sigma-70 factor (ECF subfamily)
VNTVKQRPLLIETHAHYLRPIAPWDPQAHNARRLRKETLPPTLVSNVKSGRGLGHSSSRLALAFDPSQAGLERQTVSDWASALSWGNDESELVNELQAGSETAFDWLVTHYHGPVYNLILGMLGDTSDSADASQEVFLKAFKGIRSFRQGSSLKTWLYRIAIREALNHRRWFKRHLQKNISIDAEPEEGCASIEIEDLSATPFDQLAAHEIQDAVQGALQQIPDVFRSAVILRDLEGLSYEEVAEVLDCSVGTVKSRILRGRRALKEILEPLLGDPLHANPSHANHPTKDLAQHRQTHRTPAASRESNRGANQGAPAGGAPFTSQIGLNIAYVRPAAFSAGEENTRLSWTRGEKS